MRMMVTAQIQDIAQITRTARIIELGIFLQQTVVSITHSVHHNFPVQNKQASK